MELQNVNLKSTWTPDTAYKGLETSDGYMALHSSLVAAYGNKGDIKSATRHMVRLEELRPGHTISGRRASSAYADTPGNRRFEEGMRLAGMPE